MRFVTLATAAALVCAGLATTQAATFQIIGSVNADGVQDIMPPQDLAALGLPQEDLSVSKPLAKQVVDFDRALAPGSILVKTHERALYLVLDDHKALRYPVGVGREGFTWSGTNHITRKAEWPEWRPPQVMIEREAKRGHFLPEVMPGGPKNPLGARALYIGTTEFRIHGTTQPWSIGRAVSSGCIRLLNQHVIELYDTVKVGATVVVE